MSPTKPDEPYFVSIEDIRYNFTRVSDLSGAVLKAFKVIIPVANMLLENFPNAQVFFESKNKTITHIIQPEVLSLKLLSKHYWDKYKICIFILDNNENARKVIEYAEKVDSDFVGFIDVKARNNKLARHVASMIYDKKNDHCIYMDSGGSPIAKVGFCSFSTTPLQADEHSCRITAICLLRDALISLRINPQIDFDSHLPPSQWIAGCQINPKGLKDDIISRQPFSKNEKKRTATPQKISEFREIHSVNVEIAYIFDVKIPKKEGEEHLKKSALTQLEIVTEDEKYRRQLNLDKTFSYDGTCQQRWMGYLAKKALSLPDKVSQIRKKLSDGDFEAVKDNFNDYLLQCQQK